MSVRTGDRTQGKLQVLDLAMKLCTHTLQLCKNEKLFPKNQRWLLTSRISNEALDALTCIRKANATMVDEQHYEMRREYRAKMQTEAHAHLGALYALIDVAYHMNGGLDGGRIEYWTKLVAETDDKLKAWIRSDSERYTRK